MNYRSSSASIPANPITDCTICHRKIARISFADTYLKDVFERLPTLKQRDLAQLLPHNWRPPDASVAAAAPPTTIAA